MRGDFLTTETSIYEYAKQDLSRNAERTAIWFYGHSICYRELFEKIDNAAENLYALGVRQGTVVTVHLPNCPQAVMAIYAVAKLGGICNMVHALTPEAALEELMLAADSRLLITSDQYEGRIPSCADRALLVSLDALMGTVMGAAYRIKNLKRIKRKNLIAFETLTDSGWAGHAAVIPQAEALSGRCAFYLHSSGTAGQPKTIMHSHFAVNSWEADANEYYSHWRQPDRKIYCVLPYFHGFGLVTGLHHAMVNKMEQVIVPRFSAAETVRLLKKRKVNIIIGTPALYEKLLSEARFQGSYLPALNECTVGGDRADEVLFRDFDRRLDPSGARRYLFEGYGMTELVSAVSYNHADYSYREGTAGRLLPGISARVRRDGLMYETGEGEILLSGNTMMLGYLNSAEQPFVEHDGKRWLPTGDYGRLDADGFITCLGRIKNIIIHNGYTVIPGRIEAVLAEAPDVTDVCVTGERKASSSTEAIIAWLSLRHGTEKAKLMNEFRTRCEQRLAVYERPAEYRMIETLPRNQMGKVDREKLSQCKWQKL